LPGSRPGPDSCWRTGSQPSGAYAVIDIPPSRVTHVAQGWEYDLIPTRDLGLRRRVWINRYARPGSPLYRPYDELPDLSGVPALLRSGQAA